MSMGMIAARHARDIVANAELVVAIEAMAAAQALDLRAPLEPGRAAPGPPATRCVTSCRSWRSDREFRPDIDACLSAIRDGSVVAAVESAIGPLD